MTAPTLEPLSEEELDRLEADMFALDGPPILSLPMCLRDDTARLLAELRAHRAAALSDEDKRLLDWLRSEVTPDDVPASGTRRAAIELLDRLLGRSAT